MIIIPLLFWLITQDKRLSVLDGTLLSSLAFVALQFFSGLMGFSLALTSPILNRIGLALFLGILVFRTYQSCKEYPWRSNWWDALAISFIGLTTFVLFWKICVPDSVILPVHDPIAVPAFAKAVYLQGAFSHSLQPMSDQPFTYPPGYPIFLSGLYAAFGAIDTLWTFKYLNVAAVALTPVVWAYYFRRVLQVEESIPLSLVAACFALGFYAFDRTLNLTLFLAGKNAQLFATLLFPAVLTWLLRTKVTVIDSTLSVLVIAGLSVVHYSAMYMIFCSAFAASTLLVPKRRLRAIFPVVLVLGSIGLLAPHLLFAKSQGIDITPAEYDLLASLNRVMNEWLAKKSHFFFIFNPQASDWDYKGIVILCLAGALLIIRGSAFLLGLREGWQRKCDVALVALFLMLLGYSALGFGVFPKAGINTNMTRWFYYNFVGAFAGTTLLAAVILLPPKWLKYSMIVLTIGLLTHLRESYLRGDLEIARRMAQAHRVTADELRTIKSLVKNVVGTPDEGSCRIFSESFVYRTNFTIQHLRPLEYAPHVTPCRLDNGSWFDKPVPEARSSDGLPSEAYLSSIDHKKVLFFLTSETATRFAKTLSNFSLVSTDQTFRNYRVFRLTEVVPIPPT